MRNLLRKTISHPLRVFGGSLLWGLVEFIALQKSRRQTFSKQAVLAK